MPPERYLNHLMRLQPLPHSIIDSRLPFDWSTTWSTANEGHTLQLQSIGSYETKTHLADLLRRVRDGQGFTITQRGEPVADLVPAGSSVRRAGMLAAAGMRALMLESPLLETFDIKTLIDAGRD
jgi:prevent-host-death family protein